ncbi:hypothetical protein [Marinicellulosiphila megalodicopiae]|uniref:hypothetical protein n=1 Tax=Marinicellulosiphila megalodicopiae TaxID=2724896 RepID=UPI003BB07534
MKLSFFIFSLLIFTNLYAQEPNYENPFLDKPAMLGLDFVVLPSYNDPNLAKTFLENSSNFEDHFNDIRYFAHYISSINAYHKNYTKQQLEILFARLFESFKIIPLNENIKTINQRTEQIFSLTTRVLIIAINNKLITEQGVLEIIDIRERNGLGENDQTSKRFNTFKLNLLKDIHTSKDLSTSISTDKEKTDWLDMNTSDRAEAIRRLKETLIHNQWLITNLDKKFNKTIKAAMLNRLGDFSKTFPENKDVMLNFIKQNQRPSYIKIGRKHFGYDEVDSILEDQ